MGHARTSRPDGHAHEVRLAILVDGWVQPRWAARAVEAAVADGLARVVALARRVRTGERRRGPIARTGCAAASLYRRFDDRLFARPSDALAPVDLSQAWPVAEHLDLDPAPAGAPLSSADAGRLERLRPDLVLALGAGPWDAVRVPGAALGTWWYRTGPAEDPCGGPPGFLEVMRNTPLTESTLEGVSEAGLRVLVSSLSATDPFSVRRTRQHGCSKASLFVVRALRSRAAPGPAGRGLSLAKRPEKRRCPGNLAMTVYGARLAFKFLRTRAEEACFTDRWRLLLSWGDVPSPPEGMRTLDAPRDRSWADPFPVQHGTDHYVFFEDIPLATRKGRIAVIAVAPDGRAEAPRTVMDGDDHLAYPFVFEWDGGWWMVPETSARRTVELYRCTGFPASWALEKILLEDIDASDATLHRIDGRWWMFATVAAEGALNTWDELHLFHSDTPLGPWIPHDRNPVKSDVRSARPAGRLFLDGTSLIRPAQDCSRRYGHSIVLQRVTRIDTDHFEETETRRITPRDGTALLATHTYNRAGSLLVVDGLTRFPRFGWPFLRPRF